MKDSEGNGLLANQIKCQNSKSFKKVFDLEKRTLIY